MNRSVGTVSLIVVVSFLIRLAFLVTVPPPAISDDGDDSVLYKVAGQQLSEYFQNVGPLIKEFLTGNLFRRHGVLEKYGLEVPWGAFKRGVTYPFFVGLLFWIFGSDPFPVFVAQAVLLGLTCGLVYGIGRELGEPGAGLLAAAIVGIYPPFILIVAKLLQESLTIFLFALSFFFVLRCKRTNSARLLCATGFVFFLLAFSRSTLAFFPFFLFALTGLARVSTKRESLSTPRLLGLAAAFIIPYLIWVGIVSWQMRHPAIVVEPAGREMFSALHPDYDGWTSDVFLGKDPDQKVAEVLEREGVLEPSKEGNWVWPSQPKMIHASISFLLKYPLTSLRMGLDKFRRFWWQPYDWPWRYFLVPSEPIRWLHRFLVVTAIAGWVLWFFDRPFELCLLSIPALYGTIFHSLFHIESRYGLIFFTFFPLFSSYLIRILWKYRKTLLSPSLNLVAGLAIVLGGGFLFHFSNPAFLLKWFPSLNTDSVRLLQIALQSAVLIIFFAIAGLWFREVIARSRLLAALLVTAFLILIPFEAYAFTSEDWRAWQAPLNSSLQEVRQEILLPRGSLEGAVDQNVRIDLILPNEETEAEVVVNGHTIGKLEALRLKTPRLPLGSYHVFLRDERRKAFQMRQWFSFPIPQQVLKEGKFNTVEILSGNQVIIFGDYPTRSLQPIFRGPLFQHSDDDISVLKFIFDGDFRLHGVTPLHCGGARSSFYDGTDWRSGDLSAIPGVQEGEYRIRIEIEHPGGKFFTY